ncbi:SNF2 family N-terminal domain-containing protein [Xylaria sp. FL0043]|nr:SNF2 family N-terminal domain-containing protein [Xylaria sp. FL0043]
MEDNPSPEGGVPPSIQETNEPYDSEITKVPRNLMAPISSQTTDHGATVSRFRGLEEADYDDTPHSKKPVETPLCMNKVKVEGDDEVHRKIDVSTSNEEESLFVTDPSCVDTHRTIRDHSLHRQLKPDAEGLEEGAEKEFAAKAQKIRQKTGPRARSAKEWFTKKGKDAQISSPKVTPVKRKRSQKSHDDLNSRSKRKRSDKSEAQDGGKLSGKNNKSKRVMEAMFESLSSNPIQARIALGDLPEADPIIATTKGDQLQQIMNNLPKDADKQSVAKDKRQLDEASRSFGYGKCVAKDGKWLVRGMKTPLHDHQVIGTSWMLRREFCDDGPTGGILADEMGMGKTLQTLACIVSNQASEDDLDTYSGTTLVVAPATAIEQWNSESEKHADDKYIKSVLHYKKSLKLPVQALHNMDIILVSYQEVIRQFPNQKLLTRLREKYPDPQDFEEQYNDSLGMLFKINFWRIVLDEAHNIKNHDSQTSIACRSLKGRHRWALSGTPLTNSVDEIYPYLQFLKAKVPQEIKVFRKLFTNTKDATARMRLRNIIEPLMFRRTMKDTFMGRPLYEIPTPHYDVTRVELTREERIIYGIVERRFREIINDLLAQGQVEVLTIYLVLFLRLRQGVNHPFLLETVMKDVLKTEDVQEIQRRLGEVRGKQPFFKRLGKWCAQGVAATIERKDHEDPGDAFGKSRFGYDFNIDSQLDIALASKLQGVCRICYQEPVNTQRGQCGHIFCEECLRDHIRDEHRNGRLIIKCFECKKSLVDYEPLDPSDLDDSDSEGSLSQAASQITIFRGRRLGRDKFKKHPKFQKSQCMFLQKCDQTHPEPVVPSAKTTAVKATILKWQSEAPNDKIIVFMEFKMTGAIIGRMLEAEGIPFLYFFGDMDQTAKQHAIRGFHEKSEIKVLIASIKCASVALNLTVANRVIIVDLWWNLAIEMQAFARVFRIGQTKETYFCRIVADGTIDNRIEALQEEKEEKISKLIESGGKRKLSIEETLSLFGRVKKCKNGTFQVLPDEDEEAELDEAENAEAADSAEL